MLRISSWVAAACLPTATVALLYLPPAPALGANGDRPTTIEPARSEDDDSDGAPVMVAGQIAVAATPDGQPFPPVATPVAQKIAAETSQPSKTEYRTLVAKHVAEKLDTLVSIDLQTNLKSLADELSAQLGLPVLVDPRAIKQAELDPSQTQVTLKSDHQPLRAALRKTLQPLGLRAEVQDEGLTITADFTELTRRGILTDKWVGLSDDFIARVDAVLATEVELPQEQVPLDRVIAEFSRMVDFPMVIERVALEGIGLPEDAPVGRYSPRVVSEERKGWEGRLFSAESEGGPDQSDASAESQPAEKEDSDVNTAEKEVPVQKLPLGTALRFLLSDLELTFTVRDGMIVVTTRDSAETRLMARLYFLEGTGLPRGDFGAPMSIIQTTIEPDSWEALGGVGTMVPVGTGEHTRPTLVISTTFDVHQQIADLMKSLRESHFGPDPIGSGPRAIQPSSGGMGSGFGGGWGGGMGGFGGGMGGMGGGGGSF